MSVCVFPKCALHVDYASRGLVVQKLIQLIYWWIIQLLNNIYSHSLKGNTVLKRNHRNSRFIFLSLFFLEKQTTENTISITKHQIISICLWFVHSSLWNGTLEASGSVDRRACDWQNALTHADKHSINSEIDEWKKYRPKWRTKKKNNNKRSSILLMHLAGHMTMMIISMRLDP